MASGHSQPSAFDRYNRLRLADAQRGPVFARSAFGSGFTEVAVLRATHRTPDFRAFRIGVGDQAALGAIAAIALGVHPTIRFSISSGDLIR